MKETRPFPFLAIIALTGAVGVLIATHWGVGYFADSKYYLNAARNLLDVHELVITTASGDRVPLATWPPLFPALLALIGLIGIDFSDGDRWLNALTFCGNISLVGLIIYRCTRSRWTSMIGSFLMLTTLVMLRIHTFAGTEPLFLFLFLIGLFLLGRYLETSKGWYLLSSSFAVALASLDRYPGIALIATGAISLLFLSKKAFIQKIIDSALFLGLSSAPLILWIIRNHNLTGTLTGSSRSMVFHPITYDELRLAYHTISAWFFPGLDFEVTQFLSESFSGTKSARRLIFIAEVVGFGFILARGFGNFHARLTLKRWFANQPVLPLLVVFILMYLALLLISISFFDFETSLDGRILSPLHVSVLLIFLATMQKTLELTVTEKSPVNSGIKGLVIVFVGFLLTSSAIISAVWVSRSFQDGLGYASREWKRSNIMRLVKNLPDNIHIYTNADDAVTLVTGRAADELPNKFDINSTKSNPNYFWERNAMKEEIISGKAVVVYLKSFARRTQYDSEEEINDLLNMTPAETVDDGVIFRAKR